MSPKPFSCTASIRGLFRYSALSVLVLSACAALADNTHATLEVIEVKGVIWPAAVTDDSYEQLQRAGVDFSAAGGMSALPVLNGMMGNRIKVLIDGSDISAACANEMNPPLSYISGNQISKVAVVAGISGVSMGGDNIAGVISINTIHPTFSDSASLRHQSSYLGSQFQSNGDIFKFSAGSGFANKQFSLKYDGAYTDANSYFDGNNNKVPDTLYRAQNHQLVTAWQDDTQQLAIKLSHQYIPFQGFANQYMDMTENRSIGVTMQYLRKLAAGELLARINWHGVEHEMGFFTPEKPGTMPMLTDSDDYSYQLHWNTELAADTTLILGHEVYQLRLDDIWPAVPGSMMMGPDDYVNINNGKRQRVAAFAELNQQINPQLELVYGIRLERVTTNTGDVQAYSSMMMGMMANDAIAANQFNRQDRKQQDSLADVTVLANYQLSATEQLQFGVAQKSRAPTLYERYSWGQSQMAISMIGWFGDGNGYIGDINLKPETASTASVGYQFSNNSVQLQLRPFYTRVRDYIDVELAGSVNSGENTRQRLQFTNMDATLYGIETRALWLLSNSKTTGQWQLLAELNLNRGERDDSSEPLYQQRPLHTAMSLQHQLGRFNTQVKWQWQANKTRVDTRRLENQTPGYALLDLTSQWQNDQLTLSIGITNLLDKDYQLALGGVNIAQYRVDNSRGFTPLKGAGRSFNAGIRYNF